jgi:hypothetical protein
MRNPGTITLDSLIVHILDPEGRGLVLSQRALPLNDELTKYFATHIRNALQDPSAKAASFKAIDEEAVSGCCGALLCGDTELVPGSHDLARPLYAIMAHDKRISAGDLVVGFYRAANYADARYLALLKMDPSPVFRHTTKTDDQGRDYVGFEVEDEAMPTTRERLQKCAFVQPLDPRPDYDMLLLDRQAGMEREVAKFFADDYLGVDLTFDARRRTTILYGSVVSARNRIRPIVSKGQLAGLDQAIRTLMAAEKVSVADWIDNLNLPAEAKGEIEQVVTKNLPDRKFELDRTAAGRLTSKRVFRGDDGLKLEVGPGTYDQVIQRTTYVEDAPGRPPYYEIVIHTERWDEVSG